MRQIKAARAASLIIFFLPMAIAQLCPVKPPQVPPVSIVPLVQACTCNSYGMGCRWVWVQAPQSAPSALTPLDPGLLSEISKGPTPVHIVIPQEIQARRLAIESANSHTTEPPPPNIKQSNELPIETGGIYNCHFWNFADTSMRQGLILGYDAARAWYILLVSRHAHISAADEDKSDLVAYPRDMTHLGRTAAVTAVCENPSNSLLTIPDALAIAAWTLNGRTPAEIESLTVDLRAIAARSQQ